MSTPVALFAVHVHGGGDWGGGAWSEDLLVLEDETVAILIVEELNKKAQDRKHRISNDLVFTVREMEICKAWSESRVKGLVHKILDAHFPKL